MSDWQDVSTAPHQKPVWVRNAVMTEPVLATKGYAVPGVGVSPDPTFFTSVHTVLGECDWFPAGRLVVAREWKPAD